MKAEPWVNEITGSTQAERVRSAFALWRAAHAGRSLRSLARSMADAARRLDVPTCDRNGRPPADAVGCSPPSVGRMLSPERTDNFTRNFLHVFAAAVGIDADKLVPQLPPHARLVEEREFGRLLNLAPSVQDAAREHVRALLAERFAMQDERRRALAGWSTVEEEADGLVRALLPLWGVPAGEPADGGLPSQVAERLSLFVDGALVGPAYLLALAPLDAPEQDGRALNGFALVALLTSTLMALRVAARQAHADRVYNTLEGRI